MITSRTNSNIIKVNKLINSKKYRAETNSYCVEGSKLLCDAIKYNKPINAVYVAQSKVDKLPPDLACEYTVVADNIINSIGDTVNGQGIITVLDMQHNSASISSKVLVLEQLQDPGNVGTLMRSAVAFGYNSIIVIGGVDVYSPKVVRSAMSAHFTVDIHIVDSISQAQQLLHGHQLLVADMGGTDVSQLDSSNNIALLLGNEGNGVSEQALQLADKVVGVSMHNNLESLNVAVAGSILMYTL